MSKYLAVIEKSKGNYSAYCPDLPGCAASGKTRGEAAKNIREAVVFHLEGLREARLPIPPRTATAEYVAV